MSDKSKGTENLGLELAIAFPFIILICGCSVLGVATERYWLLAVSAFFVVMLIGCIAIVEHKPGKKIPVVEDVKALVKAKHLVCCQCGAHLEGFSFAELGAHVVGETVSRAVFAVIGVVVVFFVFCLFGWAVAIGAGIVSAIVGLLYVVSGLSPEGHMVCPICGGTAFAETRSNSVGKSMPQDRVKDARLQRKLARKAAIEAKRNPPPQKPIGLDTSVGDAKSRLVALNDLRSAGLITESEYQTKRRAIVDSI